MSYLIDIVLRTELYTVAGCDRPAIEEMTSYLTYYDLHVDTASKDHQISERWDRCTMSTSTSESQQAVERAWRKAFDGDLDALDELFAEDARYEEPGYEGHGRADIKARMQEWRDGFPDFRFEVIRTVADDEIVVTHFHAAGTHDGEFQGIPATGNTFEGEGIQIDRFEDGTVVEEINIWDNLTFLEQLEVDPGEL